MKPEIKVKITAVANHKDRTFTIRKYYKDLRLKYSKTDITKYRTIKLEKSEFNSCLYNTEADWLQFLKSNDYYKVK